LEPFHHLLLKFQLLLMMMKPVVIVNVRVEQLSLYVAILTNISSPLLMVLIHFALHVSQVQDKFLLLPESVKLAQTTHSEVDQ
jgi:hypothetical protein